MNSAFSYFSVFLLSGIKMNVCGFINANGQKILEGWNSSSTEVLAKTD
jgi:hypothetical protein